MPTDPESPPLFAISLAERFVIRERILYRLSVILRTYEPFYLGQAEAKALAQKPLTQERYQSFEQWLGGYVSAQEWSQGQQKHAADLVTDVAEAVRLYEALRDISLGQDIDWELEQHYGLIALSLNLLKETTPIYSVTIGIKTGEELEQDLVGAGYTLSESAKYLMRKNDFLEDQGERRLTLARLTVQELFNNEEEHSIAQVRERAEWLGFSLCPLEVAPCLRLQITSQPIGDLLYIAIPPTKDRFDAPGLLTLECDNGEVWAKGSLHLSWRFADESIVYPPTAPFLFVLPG